MFGSEGTKGNNTLSKSKKLRQKVRLSMTLVGETARVLQELRARGVIRSYADGVNQAVRLFWQRTLEEDLRAARVRVLQSSHEADEICP